MSGLWTPGGEHVPTPEPGPGGGAGAPGGPPPGRGGEGGAADEAALAEEMRRVREEIAGTPVADLIANHAVGLWQLAVLHLTPDDGAPRLDEASLAIDAMAGIVESLGDRLQPHAEALRDALSQLRLAFVQVQSRPDGGVPDGDAPDGDAPDGDAPDGDRT